jgi:hypothetical protein
VQQIFTRQSFIFPSRSHSSITESLFYFFLCREWQKKMCWLWAVFYADA